MKLPASESVQGSWLPGLRRGPARLQASESVLCSLLSGEARRSPVLLQASESALCSWLSGEAPWIAVAPIDDGPMEGDVVPHVVEDPVALLCSVMSRASSGVTNYMEVRG